VKELPRGIAPELLVSQVENTMPYLFSGANVPGPFRVLPAARFIRAFTPETPLTHFEYFRLALSAHYLSCATPVPTDVDNQIRKKLWHRNLPLDEAIEMADLVLSARTWDFKCVSTRYTYGPKGGALEKEALDGHLGEWFTVSAGAYCGLKQYDSAAAAKKREELFEAIRSEVERHSEIFGALWQAKDGLGCLKAAASIAHNFGDLDRVMDMWELDVGDPLRLAFYKLATLPFDTEKKLRYLGRLWVAGELYKAKIADGSLALENHRHFALRKPRSLRESPSYLIPTAPFFDDWGTAVARGLAKEDGTPSEKSRDVFETLVSAWDRQPGTVAYGRGLLGFGNHHPEFYEVLLKMHGDPRKKTLTISQAAFEETWAKAALAEMDEIPSRA
jgi:hypothetical protein